MLILSAALSIDALGIGISCAFRGIQMPLLSKLVICGVSVGVTAAAALLGDAAARFLPESAAKLTGAVLLIGLGLYIAWGALTDSRQGEKDAAECSSPVETAAKLLHDPPLGDADHSGDVDIREAFCIGAALSADSFSAGIGAGIGGGAGWIPVFCGIFQLLFLCVGEWLGRTLRERCHIRQMWISFFSAGILIVIGILRV